MSFLDRLLGKDEPRPGNADVDVGPGWTVAAGGTEKIDPPDQGSRGFLRVSLFVGDLTEAPATAICTSTNPRLSLVGGTGAAVLQRAGWAVKRECEAILEDHREETGRDLLDPGTAWVTSAGALSFRGIVHCVASDDSHRSSPEIVAQVVGSALSRAGEADWESLAMPPFGTGHAHLDLERTLEAMAGRLRTADTEVEEVVLVLRDRSTVPRARKVLDRGLTAEADL